MLFCTNKSSIFLQYDLLMKENYIQKNDLPQYLTV